MRTYGLFFILIHLSILIHGQSPNFSWANHFGGNGACAIAVDHRGNSFVAGTYSSAMNIGTLSIPYTGPGANAYFIKFNQAGTAKWAKTFTRTGLFDSKNPDKILTDTLGNTYLCALFWTSATLDGVTIPFTQSSSSAYYMVAKFDSLGTTKWIRTVELPDNASSYSFNAIHLTPQGNICMTGLFKSTATFNPTTVLTNTVGGNTGNAFMATYDPAGTLIQTKVLGVAGTILTGNNEPEVFKMDTQGNLYRLVNPTKTIIKYSANGNVIMTKQIACTGGVCGLTSLAIDHLGNMFVGGYFYNGSIVLEGTAITKFGTSSNTDALLFKLNSTGTLQWTRAYQANVNDFYKQVRVDDIGNVYVVGQHSDASEVRTLLLKYTNTGNMLWQQIIIPGTAPVGAPAGWVEGHNVALTYNGGNIFVLGHFKERIYFNAGNAFTTPTGGARIFLVKYGVCQAPKPVITVSPMTAFCSGDSLLLTSSPANRYLWSTGDTTNSIYVKASGGYYVNAIADAECYEKSAYTYVQELPLPALTVTQQGNVFTAASAAGYQWINCATKAPIPGAAQQTYTANTDGSYAVVVTNSVGCSDTSDCYIINTTGISDHTPQAEIRIFPNPTNGAFYINIINADVSPADQYFLQITNALGQAVKTIALASAQIHVNLYGLPEGIYFYQIRKDKVAVKTGRILLVQEY